jgi:hypothetical protein
MVSGRAALGGKQVTAAFAKCEGVQRNRSFRHMYSEYVLRKIRPAMGDRIFFSALQSETLFYIDKRNKTVVETPSQIII